MTKSHMDSLQHRHPVIAPMSELGPMRSIAAEEGGARGESRRLEREGTDAVAGLLVKQGLRQPKATGGITRDGSQQRIRNEKSPSR